MPTRDDQPLIAAALEARQRAHAPYSGFHVGAALLTGTGSVYTGCNVENASYGLTCCAERVAVFSAIAAGETEFVAMAVASTRGVAPCGACRQVLVEFAKQLPLVLVNADDPSQTREYRIDQLLPESFGSDSL